MNFGAAQIAPIILRIVFNLVALLMLVLWLPATQHAELEAAELSWLGHGDHPSSSCEDICVDGACHSTEGVTYRKCFQDLRVPCPPPLPDLHGDWHWHPAPPRLEPVALRWDPPPVPVQHRTWQFARRTALPARAPAVAA